MKLLKKDQVMRFKPRMKLLLISDGSESESFRFVQIGQMFQIFQIIQM